MHPLCISHIIHKSSFRTNVSTRVCLDQLNNPMFFFSLLFFSNFLFLHSTKKLDSTLHFRVWWWWWWCWWDASVCIRLLLFLPPPCFRAACAIHIHTFNKHFNNNPPPTCYTIDANQHMHTHNLHFYKYGYLYNVHNAYELNDDDGEIIN